MAIPRFFREFVQGKGYRDVVSTTPPTNVSSISFDLNAIIHEVASREYAYGDYYDADIQKVVKQTKPEDLKARLFLAIMNEVNVMISRFAPNTTIVIAVDGVAPVAKIQQQRQRRYKAAADRDPALSFDSNCITPGTDFMIDLDNYIDKWLRANRSMLPSRVIYSSHLEPGEGEHKIMSLFREGHIKGDGAHIVYGLDADLIMLTMLLPVKQVYLARAEKRKKTAYTATRIDKIDIVDIETLRQSVKAELETETAIIDFVLMGYMIGNDFLPKLAMVDSLKEALDLMFTVYKESKLSLTVMGSEGLPVINFTNFSAFLTALATREPEALANLSVKVVKNPSWMLEGALITTGHETVFEMEKFRNNWYLNCFGARDQEIVNVIRRVTGPDAIFLPDMTKIMKMSVEYLRMMQWTLTYYHGYDSASPFVTYPYYYAPLLVDLRVVCAILGKQGFDTKTYMRTDDDIEFTPLHQLLAVIPPKSMNLMPYELQPFMVGKNVLQSQFPADFTRDMAGTDSDDSGISLIPFIDRYLIYDAVARSTIAPDRLLRWQAKAAWIHDINSQMSDIIEMQKRYAKMTTGSRRPPPQKQSTWSGKPLM